MGAPDFSSNASPIIKRRRNGKTTRETVARVLNELARHGVVERKKRALLIHDVEQLSEMVEVVRGE